MNSKHINRENAYANYRGRKWNSWLQVNDITYQTKLLCSQIPTSLNYNNESYIDSALIKATLMVEQDHLFTLEYESDMIRKNIKLQGKILIIDTNLDSKLNYKKTNWKKFFCILT